MKVNVHIEGRLAGLRPVHETIDIDNDELEDLTPVEAENLIGDIVNEFVLEGGFIEWGWEIADEQA